MKISDEGYIGTFILPVVTDSVRKHVDMENLNQSNISLEAYFEHLGHDLVVKLSRRRAKQFLPSTTISYPETWWDHFKERWFPVVLQEMFPIKYRVIEVGAEAYYDHILIKDHVSEVRLHVKESIDHG